MPSKTMALAQESLDAPGGGTARVGMDPYANARFIESKGLALLPAQRAFFGKDRKAKDRLHWDFSPYKDERVNSLLGWIEQMSYGLASFGLHKFLQTREKGALFANADFRPVGHPQEPAFDWIIFDQLQLTMDRILQESVAHYDPATQVIVFVFLLSPTGNSMAIWRRKLTVPNNLRLQYPQEIQLAKAALRKDYPVHVDEWRESALISPIMPEEKTKKKKRNVLSKRKWWKLW
ncbi:hypothetical protein JAAARDRAFT_118061 [Jaapia argillacea MUCL 33604]|uniref:CcmS related domain-containing protein n=1 Tax=Jaapia argillacea MUCL 33604 TaxID=933084 RepID=A0A067QC80_9AGAM|nr:hypothetical protein JAAARDRAFT_118061 [Jaapia argillacea MUCL 33604]